MAGLMKKASKMGAVVDWEKKNQAKANTAWQSRYLFEKAFNAFDEVKALCLS